MTGPISIEMLAGRGDVLSNGFHSGNISSFFRGGGDEYRRH